MSVLKTSIPEDNPRQITYENYKKIDSSKIKNELKTVISRFDEKFSKVLDKHAPLKRKLSRQIMRHVFLNLYKKQ